MEKEESSNDEEMMAMNNASREERRRKRILESGSDRAALITGRIQSLPPPSPPPSSSVPPGDPAVPTQQTHHHHHIHDASEGSNEVSRLSNVKTASQNESSSSSKCDTTTNKTTMQPQLGTPIVRKASTDGEPAIRPRRIRKRFFTSKRLNSCILESENARIVCALVIAFLVVLSYVDYALFGMNLVSCESFVTSRPLYIILLTDVTIVAARMMLANREEEVEEERSVPQDGHNWVEAVKLLERGLVVYQALRGVFIDFSVYAVVLICGLSLV